MPVAQDTSKGTAGTPSADVTTVQGVTGGTPVPTADTLASAWQDDGTESGVVRVKQVRAGLVRQPMRPGTYQADLSGSATAIFQPAAITSNGDGSGTCLTITVPAGINNGARIWLPPFYGRAFGVRWRRDGNAALADFSVEVDGVAYGVTAKHPYLANESVSVTDTESLVVVADDLLPTIPHYATITMPSDPSTSHTLVLFGTLHDANAGYTEIPRTLHISGSAFVPTGQTAIKALASSVTDLRSIRKVIYTNISGGAVAVTVQSGSTVIWQKSIAAGDNAELDFGAPTALVTTITHAAASSSAINATVIGAY